MQKTLSTLLIIMALVFCVACGDKTEKSDKKEKSTDYSSVSVNDILKKISVKIPTITNTEMVFDEELLDGIELGVFDDSRTKLKREEYDCCESGGQIEKFSTSEEASEWITKLDAYYGGELLDWFSGEHYHEQVGVFLVCVSAELSSEQRREIFNAIKTAIEELN